MIQLTFFSLFFNYENEIDADISPEGAYHYSYQTENGISGQEAGQPKLLGTNPPSGGESVQGSYAVSILNINFLLKND